MSQGLQNSQYDVFYALRKRMSNNGLAMMPVAGPYPTPSVAVALNGGSEYDLISYAAIRLGEPPVVPAPYSTNPNRVYLRGEQSGAWSMPDASGALTYVSVGWFIFGILAPEGLESDFLLGTVPFPGADQNDMLPASYLSYTMLNQGQVRKVGNVNPPNLPQILRTITGYNINGGG